MYSLFRARFSVLALTLCVFANAAIVKPTENITIGSLAPSSTVHAPRATNALPTETSPHTAIATATGILCPGQLHPVQNAACCVLYPVLSDLQNLFASDSTDFCSESAHGILHLAFHDAMGFSLNPATPLGGGADGSILTFSDELSYPINAGLSDNVAALKPLGLVHNLSDGDILHFAAVASVASCEGAPLLPFFLGRPSARAPALASNPGPLLPTDSVSTILSRFQDIGFTPDEVVALMAAHSIGASYMLDSNSVQAPFDSTPTMFDNQFYIETLLPGIFGNTSNAGEALSQQSGVVRLQSDFALARDSRTTCAWQGLMTDQSNVKIKFSAAMTKLQLLGQNVTRMVDCSDVILAPRNLPFGTQPRLPAGYSFSDLDLGTECPAPTTTLQADPGPATTIAPVQCSGYGNGCWHHQGQSTSPPETTSLSILKVESELFVLESEIIAAQESLMEFQQSPSSVIAKEVAQSLQSGITFLQSNLADFKTAPTSLNLWDTSTGYSQLLSLEFRALTVLQQLRDFHPQLTLLGEGSAVSSSLTQYSQFVSSSREGFVNVAGMYTTLVSEMFDAITDALTQTIAVYSSN